MDRNSINENAKKLATTGMLTAVILLLGMTGLGHPAIAPLKFTMAHVPAASGFLCGFVMAAVSRL